MRHHIEQLLVLEEQLADAMHDDFQRNIDAHVPTAIQLPLFKHVSVVRQILAQCASVHIGLYEGIEKAQMATAIAALRKYLHETSFDIAQLDALCYFEQWYEAADERLVVRGQARDELKFAIAYMMTWVEGPIQLKEILTYIQPVMDNFEQHYPMYDIVTNVQLALDELVDVEQIATVSIDVMKTVRYTFLPHHFGSLIIRLYNSTAPYTLLTEALQLQLKVLSEAG